MAFTLTRVCASASSRPGRSRNKQLAQLLDLDYARHMPKGYVDKVKNLQPHHTYDERFGLPKLNRWFGNRKHSESDYVQTPYRPWEQSAHSENLNADILRNRKGPEFKYTSLEYPECTPLPDEEWVYFVGDKVRVMVGPDAMKDGFIAYISRATNKVTVSNRHLKYTMRDELKKYGIPSRLFAEEQFLDVSKNQVMLVHPVTNEPTTAVWKMIQTGQDRDGQPIFDVRRVTPEDHEIPIPPMAYATYEYVSKAEYVETEKDTKGADVLEKTYTLPLNTFEGALEEEYQDEYNLKPRTHKDDTYWY